MKALITGASSGLGRDFALALSKQGYDLILVAKDKLKLNNVKKEIASNVETIVCDLSSVSNVYDLYEKIKDNDIDLFINNAGFGDIGVFTKTSLEKELNMINTNVVAVHVLTKLILKDMVKKDHGKILNVASSAAFQPGPLMATYYSTKSYVFNLTMALYEELRKMGSNVHISALCPGPVNTNFNNVANCEFKVRSLSSEYVVDYTLRKLKRNKLLIIPGFDIKSVYILGRLVPLKLKLKLAYSIQHRKIK